MLFYFFNVVLFLSLNVIQMILMLFYFFNVVLFLSLKFLPTLNAHVEIYNYFKLIYRSFTAGIFLVVKNAVYSLGVTAIGSSHTAPSSMRGFTSSATSLKKSSIISRPEGRNVSLQIFCHLTESCCCCNDSKIKMARKPGKKQKENSIGCTGEVKRLNNACTCRNLFPFHENKNY